MTNVVTCGQCEHFKKAPVNRLEEDNGGCTKWKEEIGSGANIAALSRFFIKELGGKPIHSDIPRLCTKFTGKYPFVKGD